MCVLGVGGKYTNRGGEKQVGGPPVSFSDGVDCLYLSVLKV